MRSVGFATCRILLLALLLLLSTPVKGQTADNHYQQGKKLAGVGKTQATILACNQALAVNPKHAQAYVLRGWQFLILGKPQRALADYNKAIAINPGLSEAYKARGFLERQLKQNEKSRLDLDKAIKLDPKDAEAVFLHGITCLLQGMHNQAIKDFSGSIQIDPENPYVSSSYYWRGRTRQMMADDKGAIADFCQSIKLDKGVYNGRLRRPITVSELFYETSTRGNKLGLLERGLSYSKQGEYEKATADFDLILKESPGERLIIEERGNAFLKQGKYARAMLDFNKALLEGSPSTELYYKMGLTNFCAGKYKRATVSFNAWFERNGFNDEASPLALILTYTSYRRLADNKSALNLLNRASKDKSRLSPIAIASLQAFQQGTCCNKVFSSVRKNKPADMALAHLTAAMFNSLAAKQEPYEKNLKWIIKNSSRQQDEYTIASAELNSKKSLQ